MIVFVLSWWLSCSGARRGLYIFDRSRQVAASWRRVTDPWLCPSSCANLWRGIEPCFRLVSVLYLSELINGTYSPVPPQQAPIAYQRIAGHVRPTADLRRNRQKVTQQKLRIWYRSHQYDDPDAGSIHYGYSTPLGVEGMDRSRRCLDQMHVLYEPARAGVHRKLYPKSIGTLQKT